MIGLILFLFYLALIFRSFSVLPLFRHSGLSVRGLSVLFLVKLAFGVALVLVYTYYYTDRLHADIYKYFDDGNVINQSLGAHPGACLRVITGIGYDAHDPQIKAVLADTHYFDHSEGGLLESNGRLLIRCSAVMRFFSYGSIYVHTLFFCFLAFMGLVALYRALMQFFEEDTGRILVIPAFLIPSVLFWSSGVLKESLVALFLGLLFFTAMKLIEGRNILTNLLLSALCLHFLFLSKPFIALSFLVSFYVMATFHFKSYIRFITILIAAIFAMWFFYAHDTFICGISHSLIAKRNEFTALGIQMKSGSLFDTRIYGGGCTEPLRLLPKAMYSMFMRPFIWSHGLFEKLFGTENLLVLLFSALALFYFKRPRQAKLQLAVFCFVFVLLNYALIGITVPILGALVRYKVFGLMFYLILVLCCIDLNKFIFSINQSKILNYILIRVKKTIF